MLPLYFTEAFNAFVGLDGAKDCTEQRSEVSFCLNFLVALLRRVSVPTDLLKCRNSGFIDTSVTGKFNQEPHYFKKFECSRQKKACNFRYRNKKCANCLLKQRQQKTYPEKIWLDREI